MCAAQERHSLDSVCLEVCVPPAAVLRDLVLNYHLKQLCAQQGSAYVPTFVGVKEAVRAGLATSFLTVLGKKTDQL